MPADYFLDTNILLYKYAEQDHEKRRIATNLINSNDAMISVQVLMESIALAIHNNEIKQEILAFLNKFSNTDLELSSIEDIQDLRALQLTRNEETIPFAEYLKQTIL